MYDIFQFSYVSESLNVSDYEVRTNENLREKDIPWTRQAININLRIRLGQNCKIT